MDIKKELKQIILNGKVDDEVFADLARQNEELKKQQNELMKKEHLFKVISLANKLENAAKENFFIKDGVHWVHIECPENQYGYGIHFWLLNKSEEMIDGVEKQEEFMEKSLLEINNFNPDYANEEVTSGYYYIELTPGIKEHILNLFLSDELKKIYDYNKMQLELPRNNKTEAKRKKI
jgi:hypothetical protein